VRRVDEEWLEEAHKMAGIKVCHMDVICATCTYMNLWSLVFATFSLASICSFFRVGSVKDGGGLGLDLKIYDLV
jgi:hypothetical protein